MFGRQFQPDKYKSRQAFIGMPNAGIAMNHLKCLIRQTFAIIFLLAITWTDCVYGQETQGSKGNLASSQLINFELTSEEKDWLKRHPTIEFGVDGNWPPIDFIDSNGIHTGITAEYLRLISSRLGVEFTVAPGPTFKQMLAKLMNGELKAGATVTPREERAKKLYFTKPFYRVPKVIVVRDNFLGVKDLKSLYGKKVVVEDGFAVMKQMQKEHPEIILKPVENTREALKQVSFGHADAYVGNLPVAKWLMEELQLSNLVFIADAELGSGPQAFAVFKDPEWEPLVGILDKALASIPDETRRQIQNKFIGNIFIKRSPASAELNINIFLIIQIVGGVFAIVIIFSILALVLKILDRKSTSHIYESRQFKGIGFLLVGSFLFIVVLATWFTVQSSEEQARNEIGNSLQTVLQTTNEALRVWVKGKSQDLTMVADAFATRRLVRNLLQVPRDRKSLTTSEGQELKSIRDLFEQERDRYKDLGFFVISPDRINIGSMRDENLGQTNLIQKMYGGRLDQVFRGETVFIPPIKTDVPIKEVGGKDQEKAQTMFIVAPVRNLARNKVVAALAIRLDPLREFSQIIQLGRIGKTGETYAFDRNARMVSRSRFEDQLRQFKLLNPAQVSMLNVHVRYPGGNLLIGHQASSDPETWEMTHMALRATAKRSGRNTEGYPDYRGVPVIGAWMWDSRLDIGMATEISLEEGLNSFFINRATILIVLSVTVVMALLLTGLTFWIGQSANRSLRHARDNLEVEVADRTAELHDHILELRDREERLEVQASKLIEMAEDLTVAKDGLEKLNQQKDKFFSIIAHDLKGPFTSLLGFSNMLANQVENFNKEKIAKSANTVNESAHRVYKLLENLLEWARLQMDSLDFNPAPVNLTEIIGSNMDLFAQVAKEKKIRLTGNIDEPVMATADTEMANTIIRNLINNAVKFTPEDGSVNIVAREDNGMAEVAVIDTGVGMTTKQLENVFKLDEKTSTVGTNGEKGTGLGLPLCKELAQKMGGDIEIVSDEENGSTFCLKLPLSQE